MAQNGAGTATSSTSNVVGLFPSGVIPLNEIHFITSFNNCIAFIIPVLATLLQLKYQAINDPFAVHPRTMTVAVSGAVVYYLTYIVLLRFPRLRSAAVAQHCLALSGHAAVASLASLLFPDRVSPFVYVLFALLSTVELLYSLYHKLVVEGGAEFPVHGMGLRRFLNNICSTAADFCGQGGRHLCGFLSHICSTAAETPNSI